jgi:hypothetical protein
MAEVRLPLHINLVVEVVVQVARVAQFHQIK